MIVLGILFYQCDRIKPRSKRILIFHDVHEEMKIDVMKEVEDPHYVLFFLFMFVKKW